MEQIVSGGQRCVERVNNKSDVVEERQDPAAVVFDDDSLPSLQEKLDSLEAEATAALRAQGFLPSQITSERYLNLRYEGTDTALMARATADGNGRDFAEAFVATYSREFGFTLQGRSIVVDDVRVRSTGSSTSAVAARSSCWVKAPGSARG